MKFHCGFKASIQNGNEIFVGGRKRSLPSRHFVGKGQNVQFLILRPKYRFFRKKTESLDTTSSVLVEQED
jgi:hypothetical protein